MGIRKLYLLVAVCTFTLVTVFSFPASAQAPKTIKIGVFDGLTGPLAPAEVHARDGALLAVEWINAKGGITIKGQKYLLEAVVEDNQSSAAGAQLAAERLVYQDNVKFIAGGTVPFVDIAEGAVTEKAKVIRAINYDNTVPGELSKNTPYTFRVNPAIFDGIPPSLDYLVEKYPNAKRIATITPADGGEVYLIPLVAKEAQKRGLTQVGVVTWTHDITDFYPKVTQLIALKPDVIFITAGYEAFTAQIVKGAREMGFKGPVAMGNYDDPYDVLKVAGNEVVAPLFGHGWSRDPKDLTPEMKIVIDKATAKFGQFHQWNFWGWTEVVTIAQAIEKAQSLDTTVVANTWRNMATIDTPYGPGHMCGLKTYGINDVICSRVSLTEVEPGGIVKRIKWVDVQIP